MAIKFTIALLLCSIAETANSSEEVIFLTKIDGPTVTVVKDDGFHVVIQIDSVGGMKKIGLETGQEFFQTAEWKLLFGGRVKSLEVYTGWGAGRIRSRLFSLNPNENQVECLFDFIATERVRFLGVTDNNLVAATVQDNGKTRVWKYTKDGGKLLIVPQD